MTSRTQRFLVVVGQIVPWIDQSWECAKEVLHERTTRKSTTTAEKKKIGGLFAGLPEKFKKNCTDCG